MKNPLVLSDTYSGQEGHNLDREKLKELILKGNNDYFFDSWIPFSTKTTDELNYKLDGLNEEQIKKLSKEEKVDYWLRQEYDKRGIQNILQEMSRAYNNTSDLIDNFQKIFGYDGIVVKGRKNINQYIAFSPEQIKNIDNTNPTSNPDIRYSQETNIDKELELDSDGKKLTEEQKQYFKNTTVRDQNGNLLIVYHRNSSKRKI